MRITRYNLTNNRGTVYFDSRHESVSTVTEGFEDGVTLGFKTTQGVVYDVELLPHEVLQVIECYGKMYSERMEARNTPKKPHLKLVE